MATDSPSKKKPAAIIGLAISGFLVVIITWYSFADFAHRYWKTSPSKIGEFGVFGDSFGVINSLFSGLAMLGVVITILMQHKDSEEAERLRIADARDAEEKHTADLQVQERIVKVHALSSIMDFDSKQLTKFTDAIDFVMNGMKTSYAIIEKRVQPEALLDECRIMTLFGIHSFRYFPAEDSVDFMQLINKVSQVGTSRAGKLNHTQQAKELDTELLAAVEALQEKLRAELEKAGEVARNLGTSMDRWRLMILSEIGETENTAAN